MLVETSGTFYTRNPMRRLLFVFLLTGCTTAPTQNAFDPALLHQIDARIEQAIADHKIPGGVYHLEHVGPPHVEPPPPAAGEGAGPTSPAVYEKVYGNRALVPSVEPMTIDTVFDAASITKVVATTPAVWLLIQRGKIALDDPAQKFIPEFPHPDITIRHLLTHSSALRPDLDLK